MKMRACEIVFNTQPQIIKSVLRAVQTDMLFVY
jgi:hypothetical protein